MPELMPRPTNMCLYTNNRICLVAKKFEFDTPGEQLERCKICSIVNIEYELREFKRDLTRGMERIERQLIMR